jgi:hypothetical protein
MKNYHKDIGFPDTIIFPDDKLVTLSYTKHALDRRKRDEKKMQLKILPSVVRLKKDNVFEVNTEDDINLIKVSVRVPYDYNRDITLVLELLSGDRAKVITFWLNHRNDKHENFSREKYSTPTKKDNNESFNA